MPLSYAVAGPGRKAVRLVTPAGKRTPGEWQRWANRSLMPTVDGRVTLRLSGCPGLPRAAGCVYTRQPRVIYLKPNLRNPRSILLHELGHVYDLTVLSNSDRGKFRRLMRKRHRRWWAGKRPLAEWFAESYSWCARHRRIVSIDRYAIYNYDPTSTQHVNACALIRRAARDRTPPAPAPQPPIVTGDPAPPPAPPAGIVPGAPGSAPGSPPQQNPMSAPATPTPTRAPSPTPAPGPTPTAAPGPAPTSSPTPTPTPEPTATATPDPTPTPEPTATPTPDPTPTPEPTATPTPIETPTPEAAVVSDGGRALLAGDVFDAPFDLPWPRCSLLP
jgi:hypothetical protein